MKHDVVEALGRIIGKANGHDELMILLEGLLTPHELEEALTRWQLLVMLEAGVTQRDIARRLGISLGKIARGSRLLQHGPPEFEALFRRLARDLGELP